jgi:hypothetical protein
MKKSISQFTLAVAAVIGVALLMSFAKPAADEPKQYMLITSRPAYKDGAKEDFEKEISRKMAEGWKPQGGMAPLGSTFYQAMVK